MMATPTMTATPWMTILMIALGSMGERCCGKQ
jgi:hypothetical protein